MLIPVGKKDEMWSTYNGNILFNNTVVTKARVVEIIQRFQQALTEIKDYGEIKNGGGVCPYGCDAPSVASKALDLKQLECLAEKRYISNGIKKTIALKVKSK